MDSTKIHSRVFSSFALGFLIYNVTKEIVNLFLFLALMYTHVCLFEHKQCTWHLKKYECTEFRYDPGSMRNSS